MVAIGTKPHRSKSKQFTFLIVFMGALALLLAFRSNGGPMDPSSTGVVGYTELRSTKVVGSDQRATSSSSSSGEGYNTGTDYEANNQGEETTEETNRIRQISLIGERNSGTRWTYEHLSLCFNHSIPVERHLTRYKHWFQYPNYTAYPHDTLVIAQFRNPYDWLKAMQRVPHHSPSHLKIDWKPFLTRPWTTPRLGEDIEIGKTITKENNDTDTTPCQQNFIYQDIVSCVKHPIPPEAYDHKLRFSEDTPFYEMKPNSNGQPFESIMEMRTEKILNFLDVQNYPGIAAVWAVQYEYLLQRGTQHMLDRVAEWTGIEPKCDAYEPQLRRERPFEADFVKHVTEHLNWTVEELIGYGKYKRRPSPKDDVEEGTESTN